jgi:hypothetical protein
MGAVAIAAPATNRPYARCALQQEYLCPRRCEAAWITKSSIMAAKKAHPSRHSWRINSLEWSLGSACMADYRELRGPRCSDNDMKFKATAMADLACFLPAAFALPLNRVLSESDLCPNCCFDPPWWRPRWCSTMHCFCHPLLLEQGGN